MLVPLCRDKQKLLRRDFMNNIENKDLEIRVSGFYKGFSQYSFVKLSIFNSSFITWPTPKTCLS